MSEPTVRPFKYAVQAFLVKEVDGRIVDELHTEQTVIFGSTLAEAAVPFDARIAETIKEQGATT